MNERDIIARLDNVESKLTRVLRILEHNFESPPKPSTTGPMIYAASDEDIERWEREAEQVDL